MTKFVFQPDEHAVDAGVGLRDVAEVRDRRAVDPDEPTRVETPFEIGRV